MVVPGDAEILSKIEERVTIKGDCKIWGGSIHKNNMYHAKLCK